MKHIQKGSPGFQAFFLFFYMGRSLTTRLVSYLVLQTSYITAKQFKAHKSLEVYNQSTSGWVNYVHVWNIADKYVVTGKVNSLFSLDMPQYGDAIHNN